MCNPNRLSLLAMGFAAGAAGAEPVPCVVISGGGASIGGFQASIGQPLAAAVSNGAVVADVGFLACLGAVGSVGSDPCPADINGDGELDVFDFIAFQAAFQKQDDAADCNEDGSFNVFDFICFQGAFSAGCP